MARKHVVPYPDNLAGYANNCLRALCGRMRLHHRRNPQNAAASAARDNSFVNIDDRVEELLRDFAPSREVLQSWAISIRRYVLYFRKPRQTALI